MRVVKVGGSLFDWPELAPQLRAWLTRLDTQSVLLVPGGGKTADAIRALDHAHQLGEEASHWLAIQALSLNARFLHALLPAAEITELSAPARATGAKSVAILDVHPFFLRDENRADHLPHCWNVTSDSLAVRAAVLLKASELILLKSTSWDSSDWHHASATGVVDRYFSTALQQAGELRVRIVNLRDSTA